MTTSIFPYHRFLTLVFAIRTATEMRHQQKISIAITALETDGWQTNWHTDRQRILIYRIMFMYNQNSLKIWIDLQNIRKSNNWHCRQEGPILKIHLLAVWSIKKYICHSLLTKDHCPVQVNWYMYLSIDTNWKYLSHCQGEPVYFKPDYV